MSTLAQYDAARSNSRRSTGPRTAEGKARSRFNPLRHGLTSEHLLIPGENPEDFDSLLSDLRDAWTPADPTEESLVCKLAEHEWRLIRARRVETATLAIYMEKLMDDPAAQGSHDRALALVYERYGKELDRLRRYETTISRAHHKIQRELSESGAARVVAAHEEEVRESSEDWLGKLAAERRMLRLTEALNRQAAAEELTPGPALPGFVSQNTVDTGVAPPSSLP
jgi:hypothetical protein